MKKRPSPLPEGPALVLRPAGVALVAAQVALATACGPTAVPPQTPPDFQLRVPPQAQSSDVDGGPSTVADPPQAQLKSPPPPQAPEDLPPPPQIARPDEQHRSPPPQANPGPIPPQPAPQRPPQPRPPQVAPQPYPNHPPQPGPAPQLPPQPAPRPTK